MRYFEEKRDITTVDTAGVIIAHCIAADLAWGSGIAPVIIRDMYNAEKKCRYRCSNNPEGNTFNLFPGMAMPVVTDKGTFINLITKEHSWDKPTYLTLTKSIVAFRQYLAMNFAEPKVIVMPKIGCGLDRLEWEVVSEIIKGVFLETPHVIKIVYK